MASKLLSTLALTAVLGAPAVGQAAFIVTYEAAGVQHTTAKFDYVGIETFDQLGTGVHDSYTSSFGLGDESPISGTYSSVNVLNADQYGGAGGSGHYAVAGLNVGDSRYGIRFDATGSAGINYFGYWLSALDPGNLVNFYSGGELLFSFAPANVTSLINSNKDFYGNPNDNPPRRNTGEPYVFLNFFYEGGTFDEIEFIQTTAGAGYESDNHTIGYYTSTSGTQLHPVSEPGGLALLALGLAATGLSLRRRPQAAKA